MAEAVPCITWSELSAPMETVEALESVVGLTSDWLSSEEELGGLIDEGTAEAGEAWPELTVSTAVVLHALPPTLDTRQRKIAPLSELESWGVV